MQTDLIEIVNIKSINLEELPKDKTNEVIPWEVANNHFYIGRKSPRYNLPESDLMNPYKANDHGREECIQLFRRKLWEETKNAMVTKFDTPLVAGCLYLKLLVEDHTPIKLVCHCAPKSCHGEVIKSFVFWAIKQNIG